MTFHDEVLELVRQIPRGRVATYGQIAAMLGRPRAARQVGWVLAASGLASPPVPWHRVLNARGAISPGGDPERAEIQRQWLESEGIEFRRNDTLDLKRFQWGHTTTPETPRRAAKVKDTPAKRTRRARPATR